MIENEPRDELATLPAPHRRPAKIARLPKEIRERINEQIRDGVPYAEILGGLGEAGAGLQPRDLTEWKTRGYRDWLREQYRLEEIRARREFALEYLREGDGEVHQAGMEVAALQIYELLKDFDVLTLKDKLEGDPMRYAHIVNALVRLSEGGLKYERYRREIAERKAAIEKELNSEGARGISPETRAKIENELALM